MKVSARFTRTRDAPLQSEPPQVPRAGELATIRREISLLRLRESDENWHETDHAKWARVIVPVIGSFPRRAPLALNRDVSRPNNRVVRPESFRRLATPHTEQSLVSECTFIRDVHTHTRTRERSSAR